MDTTATLTEVARQLRAVLAEADDAGSEFTMTTVSKRRIEGAAMALDALTSENGATS